MSDEATEAAEEALDVAGLRSFFAHVGASLRERPGETLALSLAFALETAFTMAIPVCFRFLVDDVLVHRSASALTAVIVALGAGIVVVAAGTLRGDWLYARFELRVLGRLRRSRFAHLMRLSMDYFARTQVADILSRFSTDIASVEQALTAAPTWGILATLDTVMSTALLFALDARLALVAMLVFPVCLIGPRLVVRRAAAAGHRRKIDEVAALGTVQEHVAAQSVVKAFGLEPRAIAAFERRLVQVEASSVRLRFFDSLLERTAWIGTIGLQVVVLAVGATLAYRGQISVGSLAAFQTLFFTLSYSVGYLAHYFPFLLRASGGMRRVNELLSEAPRVVDVEGALPLARLDREIRFEHVGFSYAGPPMPIGAPPSSAQMALGGIDFTIRAGESVAFVGPSGCGKSTVLSLLTRFHDPSVGVVAFDGRDVREAPQASLRAQMGVVFQETILFDASVRENIRLGKPDASDAEIEAAARAAEIHELIVAMPRGYDTPVGERGGRLSGGQRQRIAIARAIVRDPRVLVLDEATSALDPGAEAAINATLERVAVGRTVVSVSHRLAAVTRMDRIFVLEAGRLVAQGTHDALLAEGGLYARLWHKQSGVSVDERGERATVLPSRLASIPMFQSLDDAQQEELADALSTERVPAGRDVFRQGDRGDKLYILARGQVTASVTHEGEAPGRFEVWMGDGDTFGEIALLEDSPRTATVHARTDCVLLTLPRDRFLKLLARNPELRRAFEAVKRTRLVASHGVESAR